MSDTAVTALVTGAITITTSVIGFLTIWVKLKYSDKKVEAKAEEVKSKIDDNTEITKEGAKEASANAKAAANIAADTKNATDALAKKLNGGVDEAIEAAIKPIREALQDHALAFHQHAANDEKNMKDIHTSLVEIHRKMDR